MLQGPKVEGIPWVNTLGTNEILASKHDIAVLNVKQGHLRPPFWFFTILVSFITAKA